MKSNKLLLLSLLPITLGSAAYGAFTDKTWDGSTSGGWGNLNNWSDNSATINGSYNLIFDSGANLGNNWTGNPQTVGALTYGGSTNINTSLSTTPPSTLGRGITFSTAEANAEINILDGSTANVLLTNSGITDTEDPAITPAITLGDNLVIDHRGSGTLTIDTIIVGTGDITIQGDSLNNQVIFDNGGTVNTYTGDLFIDGGSLQVLNSGKLGNANNHIDISNGGRLRYTDAAAVADTRLTTLSAGNANLEANNGVTVNWDALIDGTGTLVKAGDGTINLNNTSNSYSGGTFLSTGTLSIVADTDSDGALGDASGSIALNGAGDVTLAFTGADSTGTIGAGDARDITVFGIGTASINVASLTSSITIDSGISGTGGIEKIGLGALSLTEANTYSGNTLVSAGTLNVTAGGSLTFYIDDGSNNFMNGGGSLNLDGGSFVFDISNATDGLSDQWTIISSSLLSSTTFGSFSVAGFTEETAGVWSDGTYQFSEATGLLTVVPEPSTFALLGGLFALSWVMLRRR